MQTNVKPGMLAYVIARPGVQPFTPDIIGRIVYVDRAPESPFIMKHIDGRLVQLLNSPLDTVWVVSARQPLPCPVKIPGAEPEVWQTYERRLIDACLRPLIDPNIDVSDEEVKELYGVKSIAWSEIMEAEAK